jgi:putative ATPase
MRSLKAQGTRFEWVAARQPWRQLEPSGVEAWLTALEGLISPQGQWRLLFSTPRIGPATGLLAALKAQPISRSKTARPTAARPAVNESLQADLIDLLRELADLEGAGLEAGQANQRIATSWLGARGWTVTSEQWNETLELELSQTRIARWLADGSSYRTQLESLGNQPLTAIQLELLHRGFGQRLNQTIPQQLAHHLVMARA